MDLVNRYRDSGPIEGHTSKYHFHATITSLFPQMSKPSTLNRDAQSLALPPWLRECQQQDQLHCVARFSILLILSWKSDLQSAQMMPWL